MCDIYGDTEVSLSMHLLREVSHPLQKALIETFLVALILASNTPLYPGSSSEGLSTHLSWHMLPVRLFVAESAASWQAPGFRWRGGPRRTLR